MKIKYTQNSPFNVQVKAMDRGCDNYGIAYLYLPVALAKAVHIVPK